MKINICLKLVPLLLITLSCRTAKVSLLENHQELVISIDSVFQNHGLKNGAVHAKRLTRVFSKLYDSIALDGAFKYAPNYKLENKISATYTISAVVGPAKYPGSDRLVESFLGYTFDTYTKIRTIAFGCFNTEGKRWGCFHYDPSQPDSTNLLSPSMDLGGIFSAIVPLEIILEPINSNNTSYKSFSLDERVSSKSRDKKVAANFTHIINNIMVYSQSTYPRRVITNYRKYNYYGNYQVKKKERKKSDFQIHVKLKSDQTNYILDFEFTGDNVNIVTMENVAFTLVLDKKRILENDYSQAMIKISPLLKSFITHNTIFDDTQ